MGLEMEGGNIIVISYRVTMYIFNSNGEFFHKDCEKGGVQARKDEKDEGINLAWRPR